MPRQKQFDEEIVLQKAMMLFWKNGYKNTSMADLIPHLGISRASLYNTFKDKEDLFLKALKYYLSTNKQGLFQFLAEQNNVKEGLITLFETTMQQNKCDADNKGCFAVNATIELSSHCNPEVAEILLRHKIEVERAFYDFLAKGVDRGEISRDKDLKVMATAIYILYSGVQTIAKVDKRNILEAVKMTLDIVN